MGYYIYKHTAPNGKVYIGQTKQKPELRWANGNGYRTNVHFYNAIQKYGWDNFKHEILFTGLTKEDADNKEIELIFCYNSANSKYGYNKDLGGNVHCEETGKKISIAKQGHFVSEETRRKLSKAATGRMHSEEDKKKQSEKQKGHVVTEQTKKKISDAQKGRPKNLTEEGRRRISDARKGKPCSQNAIEATSKPVLCVETDVIYKSLQDAENNTGINRKSISKVCYEKRKTAGGYHWQFFNEKNDL